MELSQVDTDTLISYITDVYGPHRKIRVSKLIMALHYYQRAWESGGYRVPIINEQINKLIEEGKLQRLDDNHIMLSDI